MNTNWIFSRWMCQDLAFIDMYICYIFRIMSLISRENSSTDNYCFNLVLLFSVQCILYFSKGQPFFWKKNIQTAAGKQAWRGSGGRGGGGNLWGCSCGVIWIRICDPRSVRSWDTLNEPINLLSYGHRFIRFFDYDPSGLGYWSLNPDLTPKGNYVPL